MDQGSRASTRCKQVRIPIRRWRHETNGRYRLSVLEAGTSPILRLIHHPLNLSSSTTTPGEGKPTVVFDRLPASSLHWIPEGIIYDQEEGNAKLCRINGYRWVKSKHATVEAEAEAGEMELDD
jgi:hypothetical protein